MSENPITYMSGVDLLERVHQERAKFANLWAGLTEAQMVQRPGPQDDWSVKDLIAHITWWEEHMVDWVTQAINGEKVIRTETIDEANARIFRGNKDLSLIDVLAKFDAILPKFESLVQGLTDEQINNADLVSIENHPLLHFLIGDTFGHYGTHWNDLEGYVKQVTDNI